MKTFIYGTALIMIMALSTNSFAKPNSAYGEKSKKEVRGNYGKKDDDKKGKGKSCHHHNKKGCHKK